MPWTLDTLKPGIDLKSFLDGLAKSALSLGLGSPARCATELYDAFRKLDRKPPTDGQLAADLWLQVLVMAGATAIERANPASDRAARRRALARFIKPIYEAAAGEEYDAAELIDPASFGPCRTFIEGFPELLDEIDREAPHPAEADLANDLRQALDRIAAGRWETYERVLTPRGGPQADRARRRMAWARHAGWIRERFESKPLPLIENGPTLKDVYVRLRCFHHEEIEQARGADARLERHRPKRRAHVGLLHETVAAWLRNGKPRDAIRLVCGGPGSGKSSFAVAFAAETLDVGDWNVALVNLQHLALKGDLHDDLTDYLKRAQGGAGLDFNPLDELPGDGKPLLLVFDGLDELARSDSRADDLTRRFVDQAKRMIERLQGPSVPVKALILGRSAAAEGARKHAGLDLSTLLHTLKMSPVDHQDMQVDKGNVADPEALTARDQRTEEWQRWRAILPRAPRQPPEAVTDADFEGLNGEPLLLTLLLVSGFAGAKWDAAKDNRNRVYEAIFEKVRARDREKDQPAGAGLSRDDFFKLMECLGMAAWRGGGRTGSDVDFAALRDCRCPRRLTENSAASLDNVATQFYTRADLDDRGYEFLHKSFGEYLTARGLLADARRLAKELETKLPEAVAPEWLEITAPAEITPEILRFLRDEARLRAEEMDNQLIATLVELMNWAIRHGFPAHEMKPADFSSAISANRNAHGALLAVANSLVRAIPARQENVPRLKIIWHDRISSARDYLDNLRVTHLRRVASRACLEEMTFDNILLDNFDLRVCKLSRCDFTSTTFAGANFIGAHMNQVNLQGALLNRANLIDTDLTAANLQGADFAQADLSGAILKDANICGAHFEDAENLSQEQIDSAKGDEETKLPPGIERPASWLKDDPD